MDWYIDLFTEILTQMLLINGIAVDCSGIIAQVMNFNAF